jgi:hypothetical protein
MNLPAFVDNTSQSRTRTNFSARDAAGLWWSNGESLYRCYSPAGMGWRPTVIEGISLWLIAPLLLAGGSAMVPLFDSRKAAPLHRTAILSVLALTLGSIPFCVQCSPAARILGAIDILIGALTLTFVL